MRSGLRFRSELLRTLETSEQTDRLVSPTAMAVATAVIEATDRALHESEGAGALQAEEGLAAAEDGSSIKEKSVGDYVTALDLSLDRHLSRALEAIKEIDRKSVV